MRTPTLVAASLVLSLVLVCNPGDVAAGDLVDGVRTLATSTGAGVALLRRAAGLADASAAPRSARAGTTPVDVELTLTASAAIEGFHLEVSYPLAKGGFTGSADGVACTSDGAGFFIANDRDDGTMALVQANAVALTFPITIVCRFDQESGATLAAEDVGVVVQEVVENEAEGDTADLQVAVAVRAHSICNTGTLLLTSEPGSTLDLGWTGLDHGSALPFAAPLGLPLDCSGGGGTCTIAGAALADAPVGPPIPISGSGVSMCVLSSFRDAPSGSVDCAAGCTTLTLPLLARVFLVEDSTAPCPPCVGDPTPNDGVQGGTCEGGVTPGAACDAGGITASFEVGGSEHGHTSNDCLPTGESVGELAIDLDPLTTGTSTLTANVACLSGAFPGTQCHCANQVQPHACIDGPCPESGLCEHGPIDGVCSGESFRQCRIDTGPADCEDVFPGSGTCVTQPRRCFGPTIERTGACGTDDATLTSVFCVANTRSAAVNTTVGLSGPAALTVPVHVGPGFTLPPPPAGCSAVPRTGCRTIADDKTSVLTMKLAGGAVDLTWRWLGGEDTPASAFGNPLATTAYDLCTYAPNLVASAHADPGPLVCGGAPCWRATPDGGFTYRDSKGRFDGTKRVELVPGPTGKARIVVKRRAPIVPPPLPLAIPPLVQLQASNGECWATSFTADDVGRNDASRFRAAR